MAKNTLSTLPDLESGASRLKALRKIFTYLTHIYLSVPTIAISPWVQEGIVEHSGINNGLTYSHSSIAGFISKVKPFID